MLLSNRNCQPWLGRSAVSKFIIEPHFRLQEWVAEEKGYFRAEGLDYEFRELIRSTEGQHHNKANQGAFQSIEKGREANVSCACHWTVNVAASNGHAKLYADVYSVAPSGIFVPPDSPVRTPADRRPASCATSSSSTRARRRAGSTSSTAACFRSSTSPAGRGWPPARRR